MAKNALTEEVFETTD